MDTLVRDSRETREIDTSGWAIAFIILLLVLGAVLFGWLSNRSLSTDGTGANSGAQIPGAPNTGTGVDVNADLNASGNGVDGTGSAMDTDGNVR